MKIWFDTEFIEDGKTIDLISIGLIREDGERFYAEAAECDLSRASPWVRENVLPHLTGRTMPRAEIAAELVRFAGYQPEFWAYYADYDWVALCQLYGTMMDLPKSWPMYCRDVKQLADSLGNPKLPTQKTTEHNALLDAVWCAEAWEFLQENAAAPPHERSEGEPTERPGAVDPYTKGLTAGREEMRERAELIALRWRDSAGNDHGIYIGNGIATCIRALPLQAEGEDGRLAQEEKT